MTKKEQDVLNTELFMKSKKKFDKTASAEVVFDVDALIKEDKNDLVPVVWGFDIETLPADDCDIFAPEVYEIDSRLKDPDKVNEAYKKAEKKWWDSTSLHPLTGKIAMISLVRYNLRTDHFEYEEVFHLKDLNSEKAILEKTFEIMLNIASAWQVIVGHNIFQFDIPFLIRRAWKNEVRLPSNLLGFNKYRTEGFVDTSEMFSGGVWKDKFVSLNNLLKYFGLPAKKYNGGDFADLYKKNPDEAIEYCIDDSKNAVRVYLAMTNQNPSTKGDQ